MTMTHVTRLSLLLTPLLTLGCRRGSQGIKIKIVPVLELLHVLRLDYRVEKEDLIGTQVNEDGVLALPLDKPLHLSGPLVPHL